MSKLPSSLEEMQRDILQYDLSNNPYLQGSSVPALDKELKTKSKKIIPAINELLNMVNTFSSGIEIFMKNIQDEIDDLKNEMQLINNSIADLRDTKVNDLDNKYEECFKKAAEIELDVETIKKVCKCYKNIDMGSDLMKLNSKYKIAKKESVRTISVAELYDPEKQIKVYAYDSGSKKYKFINYTFTQDFSISSVFEFNVRPLELQIDNEEGDVVMVNRSDWDMIVFIFQ